MVWWVLCITRVREQIEEPDYGLRHAGIVIWPFSQLIHDSWSVVIWELWHY